MTTFKIYGGIVTQCCAMLAVAFGARTDSEGWGALMDGDGEGNIEIGYGLDPPKFCPWCGKAIETRKVTRWVNG